MIKFEECTGGKFIIVNGEHLALISDYFGLIINRVSVTPDDLRAIAAELERTPRKSATPIITPRA